jgi:hypothetical protein
MLFLPWLLKNEFFAGIPVRPLIWVSEWLPIDRVNYSSISAPGKLLGWHDVFLPLSMTWFGIEGGSVAGLNRYYADIGPLLILFAIPGLIDQRRNKSAQIVFVWIILGLFTMLIVGRINNIFWQTRIYFVLLPGVALAVGWGWQALTNLYTDRVRIRRIAASVVLLVMFFSLWGDINQLFSMNPIGTLLGVKTRNEYLEETLGWYIPATMALNELPEGSRVFFLWEARGLYAPVNSKSDGLIDNWYLVRKRFGDDDGIMENLKNDGYTHLLIYVDGAEFERNHRKALTQQDWIALENLLGELPPPKKFGNSYELYSLVP